MPPTVEAKRWKHRCGGARPLWKYPVMECLDRIRFVIYQNERDACIDGVSGMRTFADMS